jgi:hypothetical protein
LGDNRPGVVAVIAEVHGASRDFASCVKNRLMHTLAVHAAPAEGWKQRRVNVDHATTH